MGSVPVEPVESLAVCPHGLGTTDDSFGFPPTALM
jgi:hypothetical protein